MSAQYPDRRVAMVTGGARGIGLGIARALAAEGIDLALCGRSPISSAKEAIDELRASGVRVEYFSADVSDKRDRSRLVADLYDRLGTVDILINNAGVAPETRLDLLETTEDSYDRVMSINLRGPFFLTQAIANRMVAEQAADRTRVIVNITSISSTVASPSRGEYCISKAGLSMMTSLFAVRLAGQGILVYEVRPGVIRTDMTEGVVVKYDKLIGEGLVLQGRWGYPEDVGKATAGLVRGDFPYSTGQVVMVDGGMLIDTL